LIVTLPLEMAKASCKRSQQRYQRHNAHGPCSSTFSIDGSLLIAASIELHDTHTSGIQRIAPEQQ